VQTFTAVNHREEELFIAECPEVGTASQGTTIEEAIAMLKGATQLYLEEFPINSNLCVLLLPPLMWQKGL
jgi:predicted RNase H-like HicB family nuclease